MTGLVNTPQSELPNSPTSYAEVHQMVTELAHQQNDISKKDHQVQEHTQVVDELRNTGDMISALGAIVKYNIDGKPMSPFQSSLMKNALWHSGSISQEAYNSDTVISMESLRKILADIWVAIKNSLKRLLERLIDFLTTYYGMLNTVEDLALKLKAILKENNWQTVTVTSFPSSNARKIAIGGKLKSTWVEDVARTLTVLADSDKNVIDAIGDFNLRATDQVIKTLKTDKLPDFNWGVLSGTIGTLRRTMTATISRYGVTSYAKPFGVETYYCSGVLPGEWQLGCKQIPIQNANSQHEAARAIIEGMGDQYFVILAKEQTGPDALPLPSLNVIESACDDIIEVVTVLKDSTRKLDVDLNDALKKSIDTIDGLMHRIQGSTEIKDREAVDFVMRATQISSKLSRPYLQVLGNILPAYTRALLQCVLIYRDGA